MYNLNMNKIVPQFQNSLFSSMADSIPDIAEFGIDSILDEGTLKNFPLMSTLVGVKNVAQNLHDRNLLRQTLTFVKELNNGQLDEEKKEEYKKKIDEDPKRAEAELGRILIILNQNIDTRKSAILASLFRSYINGVSMWDEFCDYAEIVDRMFLSDLKYLRKIYEHDLKKDDYMINSSTYSANRLSSLGLINMSRVADFYKKSYNMDYVVHLTACGRKFCAIISDYLLHSAIVPLDLSYR